MADPVIIGEIIEASTTEFAAESRELHSPPAFGSFVKIEWNGSGSLGEEASPTPASDDPFEFDSFRKAEGSFGRNYRYMVEDDPDIDLKEAWKPAIYGVVYHATTGPADSSRKVRAYWKSEEELKRDQPEMEWLLLTGFKAVIIGYSSSGYVQHSLPAQPPRLHCPVQPCSDKEIRRVTSEMGFLSALVKCGDTPVEELIAACIREANRARGGSMEFLVAAGKELATVLKDDYHRLQAIVRRIGP